MLNYIPFFSISAVRALGSSYVILQPLSVPTVTPDFTSFLLFLLRSLKEKTD